MSAHSPGFLQGLALSQAFDISAAGSMSMRGNVYVHCYVEMEEPYSQTSPVTNITSLPMSPSMPICIG